MTAPFRKYTAWQITTSEITPTEDDLVSEVPLTIVIGDEPLTTTMQTPGDEEDLVRGLLYTEGIWKRTDEPLQWVRFEQDDQGYIHKVYLASQLTSDSVINKRSLLSVSACGICGKTEFLPASGKPLEVDAKAFTIDLEMLFGEMRAHQTLFTRTGGCHAAAAFATDHQLLGVREDIGRHNAVDKVIGMLIDQSRLRDAAVLTVSGRVSYEIIAKAFAAGIPVVAAVSSVSGLAVDYARELGITLIGFCREGRATIYSHPERLFGL